MKCTNISTFIFHSVQQRVTIKYTYSKGESCYESKTYGTACYLDAVAVMDEEDETLTIFAVNKNLDEDMELNLELRQFANYHIVEAIMLTNPDMKAVNTAGI